MDEEETTHEARDGAVSASSGLSELASGVDALYMSARADLSASLIAGLSAWRDSAGREDHFEVELLGESFRASARAWGRYPFLLRHNYGRIGFTDSSKLPAVRIQPLTEHLHAEGPLAAVGWWRDLCEAITGTGHLTASRLDLYADWQGWDLDVSQGARFLCRASRRDTHEDRNEFTGFEFGRRNTNTVAARIYDKTRQAERKGLELWRLVWGDRFDPQRRVLRVEFELGRKGLTQFGVDRAEDALEAGPGIWGAVTEKWLSHRVPSGDCTPSRWPVSPEWSQIQRASVRGEVPGLDRLREAKRAQNLRSIMPGLMGYTSSFGALVGADTLHDALAVLPGHLEDYGLLTGRSFADRVAEKRRKSA
jgi:X-X-X-Leu-X-X-Gly heptad repeat protein